MSTFFKQNLKYLNDDDDDDDDDDDADVGFGGGVGDDDDDSDHHIINIILSTHRSTYSPGLAS